MNNLIPLFAHLKNKTEQQPVIKNLDWFLREHYYDSDYERGFTESAIRDGMMNSYGEINDADGHIAQTASWFDCLYWLDEDDEIIASIRDEVLRVEMWWEVQGRRMLNGEHFIVEE